ncbi:hypothetical protein OZ410_10130 [Robiginitalea sp. M366]|uniref:hypothetical protein n=1 Tax=Robiginitalea aestuariiviva TaxID=3036903 RepID=UPI00240DDDBF|nr:hypothetical protein [Robiginitalea aestuariiviva]MDG1572672.1 hypothetical protein [Robiginitalea aestuariiviva]
MLTPVIQNSDLHFEHLSWMAELRFWQDELQTFSNRLADVITRHSDRDFLKKLEHYQNEIRLHEIRILDLLEDTEKHEARIAGQSRNGTPETMDFCMVKAHVATREKMETEREIYSGFKKEFFRFLTEYM